jgi:hypothetical protein
MILAGELSYHVAAKETSLEIPHTPEFQKFLGSDEDAEVQATQFRQQRELLSSLRQSLHKSQRSRILHMGTSVRESIDCAVKSQIGALQCEKQKVLREMELVQRLADKDLMHHVQQYFSLLKDELIKLRLKLSTDSTVSSVHRRQAKMLRDIRVFAHYLYHETSSKVVLTALPRDSAQFKRCKKAVKDNTSKQFLVDAGFQGVKVLAVFKLENAPVSDHLQTLAGDVDNGKVKGLFCVIPKLGFHAVCAYGLHLQQQQLQQQQQPTGLDDLFQVPWFRTDQDELRHSPGHFGKATEQKVGESDSSSPSTARFSAERLAKDSLQYLNSIGGTSPNSADISPMLRFSRQCTLSSLQALPKMDLEEGVLISLCRVLVSRLRTMASLPSPTDIGESLRAGYDAIFCSLSDEYILLNPAYILPEFIMLVHFVVGGDEASPLPPQGLGAENSTNCWVPAALQFPQHDTPSVHASAAQSTLGLGDILLGNEIISQRKQSNNSYAQDDGKSLLAQKRLLASEVDNTLRNTILRLRELLCKALGKFAK